MDWSPTLKVESKARPGVTVTIKRLTALTRALLNLKLAETQAKLLEISREMEAIREDIGRVPLPGQEMPDGTISEEPQDERIREYIGKLKDCARRFDGVMLLERNPVLFAVCVESVSDLGMKLVAEYPVGRLLYEDGPADLSDEVLAAIESEYGIGISGDDAKNSESLTTSGAVVDGAIQPTTA